MMRYTGPCRQTVTITSCEHGQLEVKQVCRRCALIQWSFAGSGAGPVQATSCAHGHSRSWSCACLSTFCWLMTCKNSSSVLLSKADACVRISAHSYLCCRLNVCLLASTTYACSVSHAYYSHASAWHIQHRAGLTGFAASCYVCVCVCLCACLRVPDALQTRQASTST